MSGVIIVVVSFSLFVSDVASCSAHVESWWTMSIRLFFESGNKKS